MYLNILFSFVVRYFAVIVNFITIILIGRSLGADKFGAYSTLVNILLIAANVLAFGVGRSIIAGIKDFPGELNEYCSIQFGKIVSLSFMSIVVFLFFLILVLLVLGDYTYGSIDLRYLFPLSFLVALLQLQINLNQIFSLVEKVFYNQISFFFGRLFLIVLVSINLFIFNLDKLSYYLVFFVLSNLLIVVIQVYVLSKRINIFVFSSVKEVVGGIKESGWLHVDTVGSMLITYSTSLVVNGSLSSGELGKFNLSLQLVNAVMIIPSVIQLYINKLVTENISLRKLLKINIFGFLLVCIVIACLFFVFPIALPLLLGDQFEGMEQIFKIMLLIPIFGTVSKLILPTLIYNKYNKFLGIQALFSGLIGLFLAYYIVNRYGVVGVSVISVLPYLISMCLYLAALIRINHLKYY